ncbi:MAG: flagellar biosynthesis protein FlhB [Planctomycetes bacterium]|nr:flagellar biosynthesis protein FlhB [Planctomycetota bacterium]MCB9905028.1 flagellar biosynthesis protein FlhB [Planctomycetota bacterium]
MADEQNDQDKTEEASPRRREEAREKGQVAFSQEFTAAGMLLAGLGVVLVGGGAVISGLGNLVSDSLLALGVQGTSELDIANAAALINADGMSALEGVAYFAVPLFLIGLLVAYGQVGFKISPKAVELNPGKINPVKGLEKMFSMRAVVRTGLAVGKIGLIGVVMVIVASGEIANITGFEQSELEPVLAGIGAVVSKASIAALVAILALGLVDMLFQRFQHGKDLRMTKQEVREEQKNIEGDPHIKARIRQVQREMASRRMMAEVPEATVVVTNPTHFAVALKYDRDTDGGNAPVVVAKGVDHVAQKIKEIARENGVVLFEDVPLARALHAQVEIGEAIPEQFFEAVAGVLAYVYRVQGTRAAAAV